MKKIFLGVLLAISLVTCPKSSLAADPVKVDGSSTVFPSRKRSRRNSAKAAVARSSSAFPARAAGSNGSAAEKRISATPPGPLSRRRSTPAAPAGSSTSNCRSLMMGWRSLSIRETRGLII